MKNCLPLTRDLAPGDAELDAAGGATCDALARGLGVTWASETWMPVSVPIGIEIEVPWRSYFPSLWTEFGLAHLPFARLAPADALALTQRCTELERDLLPRLQACVAAGVPRGNDRYWEFAHRPVHDAALLLDQVGLLTAAGLLPRDRAHSLQVTVGDLAPGADLYYLAMLLEVRHVTGERLVQGLAAARHGPIFTGWARKGRAGILRKTASDLQHGSVVASELRMLQLPTDAAEFRGLMATLVCGVKAIVATRQGLDTVATRGWRRTVTLAREVLREHGLADCNWSAEAGAAAIDHRSWARFVDALGAMRRQFDAYLPAGSALTPA